MGSGNRHFFYSNGIYGVSATVDDSGNLVIGTPTTFDSVGYQLRPYVISGSIGRIVNGGRRGKQLERPTIRYI